MRVKMDRLIQGTVQGTFLFYFLLFSSYNSLGVLKIINSLSVDSCEGMRPFFFTICFALFCPSLNTCHIVPESAKICTGPMRDANDANKLI